MKDPDSFLKDIKRIVNKKYPQAKVYLYGSRVRGAATSESDWDFLILLNKEKVTPEMEDEITSPLYDLELEIDEVISSMIYTEKEWNVKYKVTPFYRNVMKEGQLL